MSERTVPIKGMHCKACTIVIGDALEKVPGVDRASVSLKTNTATIHFTTEPSTEQLAQAVEAAGYSIGVAKKSFFSTDRSVYGQFMCSLFALIVIIIMLRSLGMAIPNFSNLKASATVLALVIGLTAGFSTCMAMLGGLVLGLSARYAEKHPQATTAQKFQPHLLFNLGRVITFFILGGLLGVFGSAFRFNSSVLGILTIIVAVVMVILGLQLTELFPRLSNKGIALPAGLAKKLGIKRHGTKQYNHKNALLLGAVSFFLPCGFTQAMQLVAISSGSFVTGSLVMGLFAIGTMPGLLGVGALTSVVKGSFATSFFRFVGVAVVLMALYNVSNGMSLMGYTLTLPTRQSANTSQSAPTASAPVATGDILKTSFTVAGDISQKTFTVTVGKPYILEVDAQEDGRGCMSTIMIPGIYKNPLLITKGIIQLPFTIDKPGTYRITCAMGIQRGTITAVEARV